MRAAVLFVTALFLASPAAARTYYVTPSGSDAASGDATHPWRTLQRAVAAADAGDTVTVRGGIYQVSNPVRPAHSGRPGAPITLRADVEDPAIIDASEYAGTGMDAGAFGDTGAFDIEGVSYWRIENLQVRNSHTV